MSPNAGRKLEIKQVSLLLTPETKEEMDELSDILQKFIREGAFIWSRGLLIYAVLGVPQDEETWLRDFLEAVDASLESCMLGQQIVPGKGIPEL